MLKNFRTFHLSVAFYRQVVSLKLPTHLRDQLHRAASSISLNLSEGAAKSSPRDQRRFFEIAFGSLRESQAILLLAVDQNHPAVQTADQLAASLYRLLNPRLS
jgi:four helix bundle protein